MSRAYNNQISDRINRSLNRREALVRRQKKLIGIATILIVSFLILLGTGIKTFASSKNSNRILYKYYTSIQIQPGDTLWDIAENYTIGTNVTREEYIKEVCALNHMNENELKSGESIVISYYSFEEK